MKKKIIIWVIIALNIILISVTSISVIKTIKRVMDNGGTKQELYDEQEFEDEYLGNIEDENDKEDKKENNENREPSAFQGVIDGYSDIVKITLTIAGLSL